MVVERRIIDTFDILKKVIPHILLDVLVREYGMEVNDTELIEALSIFKLLCGLLEKPMYSKNESNFGHLLNILECIFMPLTHIPKYGDRGVGINSRVQKDLFLFSF